MNPYKLLLSIIGYFFITALIGSIIGSFIDNQFNIKPVGTLLGLALTYIASWVGIYIYLKKKKHI